MSAGCNIGPEYNPPCTEISEEWKAEQPAASSIPCVDEWWEVFGDPRLNALEEQAIDNNPNLFIALQRVVEARGQAGVSAADLYPQFTINPAFDSTGTLFKLYLPSGVFALVPGLARVFRVHELIYFLPLNMNYELDLWGKLRGKYRSAFLNAEAQEEAMRATWLTLTADVASNYFNLRAIDAQIQLLKETVDSRRRGFELNLSRFKGGIVAYIDVTNAELQLANTESEYLDNIRQRTALENALAVLIGVPATDFCLEANPLEGAPPVVPAGIPCSILVQRPDIAQAELSMVSQHALIGVAYASFLPSFNLTGTVGFQSPDFHDFLKWNSRYWQVGYNSSQVFFDAGLRAANVEIAWARYEEARGNYRQTVLAAFSEVENALNDIEWQTKQAKALDVAVRAAIQTNQLSNNRYNSGIVSYLEVVQNEQQELGTRQNYINLLGLRYQATINLIKALGGRWGNYDKDCCDSSM